MSDFGNGLVLLFIVVLLYILVYTLVSWIVGGSSSLEKYYTGGFFGGYQGRKKKAGMNEIKVEKSEFNENEKSELNEIEIEKEKKCSCVDKCECAANPLLLHYKKIIERNPNAKDKIIVQLHSTDWCEFCKKMKPLWEEAILRIKNDPNVSNKFLFLEQNQDECNSPGIKTVPAIYKFKNDENSLKKYENVYDTDNLHNWILTA